MPDNENVVGLAVSESASAAVMLRLPVAVSPSLPVSVTLIEIV